MLHPLKLDPILIIPEPTPHPFRFQTRFGKKFLNPMFTTLPGKRGQKVGLRENSGNPKRWVCTIVFRVEIRFSNQTLNFPAPVDGPVFLKPFGKTPWFIYPIIPMAWFERRFNAVDAGPTWDMFLTMAPLLPERDFA